MDLRAVLREETNKPQGWVELAKLNELLTVDRICAHLVSHSIQLPNRRNLAFSVKSHGQRLFASLVLCQQELLIKDLLVDKHITDHTLTSDLERVVSHLPEAVQDDFWHTQWDFPLNFERDEHRDMPKGFKPPFKECRAVAYQGRFGLLDEVQLGDGHLEGYDSKTFLVMKTLALEHSGLEKPEEEMKVLRQRKHPSIIPLLMSFSGYDIGRSGGHVLCLLFPRAKMDIEQLLCKEVAPIEFADGWKRRRFFYNGTLQLLSALTYLNKPIDGVITSHHDIKPANMLWTERGIEVCDLGKVQPTRLSTDGSDVSSEHGLGSFNFQPPEYYTADGARSNLKHGRAFDMWSVGCVLIEFAILITYGWESKEIRKFEERRKNNPHRKRTIQGHTEDASYFNNMEVVLEEVEKLRQRESENDGRLGKLLDVATGMLRENPTERLRSWEALLDLYSAFNPKAFQMRREGLFEMLIPAPRLGKEGPVNPFQRAVQTDDKARVEALCRKGWLQVVDDVSRKEVISSAEEEGRVWLKEIMRSSSQLPQLYTGSEEDWQFDIDVHDDPGLQILAGGDTRPLLSNPSQGRPQSQTSLQRLLCESDTGEPFPRPATQSSTNLALSSMMEQTLPQAQDMSFL